jgi:hypothetical protein
MGLFRLSRFFRFFRNPSSVFIMIIAGISTALFLPVMGHGFVHDDFHHLYSAAYHSIHHGLTRANEGQFYAPIAWLTHRLDWILWGQKPFLSAMTNLLLHIANIGLLYTFVLRLWRSEIAARWSALGFALLYPANTWAVMWISTRAHLLVTLFYLAALLATLWLTRTENHRRLAALTIVIFASLAIFSKESGVTIPAAIAIVLFYVKRSEAQKGLPLAVIGCLFAALFAVLGVYAILRGRSGAIPMTFSGTVWYSYTPSFNILFENLLRYGWRTYGLLLLMAMAIVLSQIIRGCRLHPRILTRKDTLFSIILFAIAISPFIFLRARSGMYTYLPGTAAALLLGSMANSLYQLPISRPPRLRLLSLSPILLVILILSILTVMHCLKWMRMAEVNTAVLNQITAQQVKANPGSIFILTYSEVDKAHGFPDSFGLGFPDAIRVLYADPGLGGSIVHQRNLYTINVSSPVTHFTYSLNKNGEPQVIMNPNLMEPRELRHSR